ncbi:MAG: flagellar filament capping protein FliD, partial [Eubacteriales bacterium]|nr:flagellar filament capping protein FliD [Eubacteriales bacterium]
SLVKGLISEEANSDYPPLTDEQKKEMTDDEIKLWEEKAKSGILRGDSTLRSLASKLTNSLFATVPGGGTSLYEMGIASSGYDPLGKIGVNKDKLKTALSTNMGEIVSLFTATGGLSDTFDSVIDSFAKTSGPKGSRGILVDLAGVADTLSATQNSLFDQLERITEFKAKLSVRLKSEEQRYWAKFTAMETALSRLNAQSSIITSFGSSN